MASGELEVLDSQAEVLDCQEQEAKHSEAEKVAQKAKEAQEQAAAQAKKAQDKMDKLISVTSLAYQLSKNSEKFTCKNLSAEAVSAVKKLENAPGKCAKCRWQSGCLACDPQKCLRYYLFKEAKTAKKGGFPQCRTHVLPHC